MTEASRLLGGYPKVAGRFDEMLDEGGAPRPHWEALLAHLAPSGTDALPARSRFVSEALVSDGVSFNVFAHPGGSSRPWELDLLPLVLPEGEWRAIASGVAQRARLLDAVLRDLFGPQTLLAEGLVPPALVFGQRSFPWPVHGVPPPGGTMLHLYAADLARAPDGTWWILADRTRGPAGAGYALQNRMTLTRALPEAFRELPVEPLAPFFAALSDALYRGAPTHGEPPLAVLLTPGPLSETYFEQSFLARYLGFPLVEGQDLVVRGDSVFLKTLRGLRRVHAILRRLDDDLCDPVELRADSALGVPGLLHAIRAGNVLVANAIGAGVLETAAFGGFYPAVSERLFGEALALPSIATWWCGEPPALAYALEHLEDLVIKPTYPSMRLDPIFGHALSRHERDALGARLRAQPHAWVAQEWVRLSQAPTWSSELGALVPRAATLRVFAVATPTGWIVLPGGLTRVAPHEGDVVSMRWGGSSKDTWTLSERPVARIPLRRPRLGQDDVVRSGVDLPSRVGESLFWMGRYAERCEGLARVLRAALVRVADAQQEAGPALASLTAVGHVLEIFPRPPEASPRTSLPPPAKGPPPPRPGSAESFVAAALDGAIPGSLAANVARLSSAASHVRERMSTDNWHVLNRLAGRLPGPDGQLGAALEALDETMMATVALAGFAMDDMTRDESWHFLLVGRRLERLANRAAIVATVLRLQAAVRTEALEWLLEVANSIVTFRARYRRAPELLPVIHLVVLDETNPHAVAFQLRELSALLGRIAGELSSDVSGATFEPTLSALRGLDLSPLEPAAGADLDEACARLADLLAGAERAAYALSDELYRRFFTHAATPAPLGIEEAR